MSENVKDCWLPAGLLLLKKLKLRCNQDQIDRIYQEVRGNYFMSLINLFLRFLFCCLLHYSNLEPRFQMILIKRVIHETEALLIHGKWKKLWVTTFEFTSVMLSFSSSKKVYESTRTKGGNEWTWHDFIVYYRNACFLNQNYVFDSWFNNKRRKLSFTFERVCFSFKAFNEIKRNWMTRLKSFAEKLSRLQQV